VTLTIAKAGSGAATTRYYLATPLLDYRGSGLGTWHDPEGVFEQFGVVDRGSLDISNLRTYYCLACGFDPRSASGAFRTFGGVNIHGLAYAIWVAATIPERKKIAARFGRTLGVSATPWTLPDRFGITLRSRWFDARESTATPGRAKIASELLWAARQASRQSFLLTEKASYDRLTGLDMTFSAPRDYSLLFALADEENRQRLVDLLKRAANAGLEYLQRHAGRTRVRRGGKIWTTECEYAAVKFFHCLPSPVEVNPVLRPPGLSPISIPETNKEIAIDPHLHVHVHLLNLVRDATGEYRALDSKVVLDAAAGVELAFHNELAFLTRTELGLHIVKDQRRRVCRIEKIPDAAVEAMSLRSRQVAPPPVATKGVWGGYAGVEYRRRKTRLRRLSIPLEMINAHWQARGAAAGFGSSATGRMLLAGRPHARRAKDGPQPDIPPSEVDLAAERIHLDHSTFTEDRLAREVLWQAMGNYPTRAVLRQCAVATVRLLHVGLASGRNWYVSPGQVTLEKETIALAQQKNSQLARLALDERALVPPGMQGRNSQLKLIRSAHHLRIYDAPDSDARDEVAAFAEAILRNNDYRVEIIRLRGGEDARDRQAILHKLTRSVEPKGQVAFFVKGAEYLRPAQLHEILRLGCRANNIVILFADMRSLAAVAYAELLLRVVKNSHCIMSQPKRPGKGVVLFGEFLRQGWVDTVQQMIQKSGAIMTSSKRDASIRQLCDDLLRETQPGKTQAVLALRSSTCNEIWDWIGQQPQWQVSPDASPVVIELEATNRFLLHRAGQQSPQVLTIADLEGQFWDHCYVVQEGQDRFSQYVCLTRHRIWCRHYADRESIGEALREHVTLKDALQFDARTWQIEEVLPWLWKRRQYKVSALSSLEDYAALAAVPALQGLDQAQDAATQSLANEFVLDRWQALRRIRHLTTQPAASRDPQYIEEIRQRMEWRKTWHPGDLQALAWRIRGFGRRVFAHEHDEGNVLAHLPRLPNLEEQRYVRKGQGPVFAGAQGFIRRQEGRQGVSALGREVPENLVRTLLLRDVVQDSPAGGDECRRAGIAWSGRRAKGMALSLLSSVPRGSIPGPGI
jgi:hypothetical protein